MCDLARSVQSALSQWTRRRSMGSMGSMDDLDQRAKQIDDSGGEADIYLAAGTEHGSVYLWHFSAEDCISGFRVDNVGIDDGTRLKSILQSSDRPIVNVTMTFKREIPDVIGGAASTPKHISSTQSVNSQTSSVMSKWRQMYGTPIAPRKLLLSASDTSCSVRTYVYVKQTEIPTAIVKAFKGRSGLVGQPSFVSLRSFEEPKQSAPKSRKPFADEAVQSEKVIEGLMITGEAHFKCPVVSCFFPINTFPTSVSLESQEAKSNKQKIRDKQVHFSSFASALADTGPPVASLAPSVEDTGDGAALDHQNSLVVCLANDEIRFYPSSEFLRSVLVAPDDDASLVHGPTPTIKPVDPVASVAKSVFQQDFTGRSTPSKIATLDVETVAPEPISVVPIPSPHPNKVHESQQNISVEISTINKGENYHTAVSKESKNKKNVPTYKADQALDFNFRETSSSNDIYSHSPKEQKRTEFQIEDKMANTANSQIVINKQSSSSVQSSLNSARELTSTSTKYVNSVTSSQSNVRAIHLPINSVDEKSTDTTVVIQSAISNKHQKKSYRLTGATKNYLSKTVASEASVVKKPVIASPAAQAAANIASHRRNMNQMIPESALSEPSLLSSKVSILLVVYVSTITFL